MNEWVDCFGRPNSFHQFHQSSLWEWEDWLRIGWNERAAAPREQSSEELSCCSRGEKWEWSWAVWLLLAVGYRRLAAIMLRKEEDEPAQWNVFCFLCFPFENEEWMIKLRKQMERGRGQEDKQFMNQWREIKFIWFFFVDEMNWVGYGRWPSCSAPIPFH